MYEEFCYIFCYYIYLFENNKYTIIYKETFTFNLFSCRACKVHTPRDARHIQTHLYFAYYQRIAIINLQFYIYISLFKTIVYSTTVNLYTYTQTYLSIHIFDQHFYPTHLKK